MKSTLTPQQQGRPAGTAPTLMRSTVSSRVLAALRACWVTSCTMSWICSGRRKGRFAWPGICNNSSCLSLMHVEELQRQETPPRAGHPPIQTDGNKRHPVQAPCTLVKGNTGSAGATAVCASAVSPHPGFHAPSHTPSRQLTSPAMFDASLDTVLATSGGNWVQEAGNTSNVTIVSATWRRCLHRVTKPFMLH